MSKKHSFAVHKRAFAIWQKLGFYPWKKPAAPSRQKGRKGSRDFYKGAFDSIPFLNEDAKRTFTHLLLRPGYMIRDYIKGEHERYLAPLTALIVFYAFFALVSAVLQPVQQKKNLPIQNSVSVEMDESSPEKAKQMIENLSDVVLRGYIWLHLDEFPEEVDTQHESALAALEGTLRSQGIPLFLGNFIFLWLAMAIALRRQEMGVSAHAAASAFILCQFSFFMLFAVLLTFGKSTSINIFLMLVLLVVDYHQWLGLSWKKSLGRAVSTGIWYAVLYGLMILLISAVALLVLWKKIL